MTPYLFIYLRYDVPGLILPSALAAKCAGLLRLPTSMGAVPTVSTSNKLPGWLAEVNSFYFRAEARRSVQTEYSALHLAGTI